MQCQFKKRQWSVKLEFSDFISHKLFFRHKLITPRSKGKALLPPLRGFCVLGCELNHYIFLLQINSRLSVTWQYVGLCWLLALVPRFSVFLWKLLHPRTMPASSNPLTVWRIKVLFKSLTDFGAVAWTRSGSRCGRLFATILTLWWELRASRSRERRGQPGSPLKFTKLWREQETVWRVIMVLDTEAGRAFLNLGVCHWLLAGEWLVWVWGDSGHRGMLQCLLGARHIRGWEGGASGPASDLGHSDLDTEGRMQMEEQRTPFVKYHPSGDPSWWDLFTLLPHPRPNYSKSWQISAIRSNLLRISRYSQPGISTTRPALSSIPHSSTASVTACVLYNVASSLCFKFKSPATGLMWVWPVPGSPVSQWDVLRHVSTSWQHCDNSHWIRSESSCGDWWLLVSHTRHSINNNNNCDLQGAVNITSTPRALAAAVALPWHLGSLWPWAPVVSESPECLGPRSKDSGPGGRGKQMVSLPPSHNSDKHKMCLGTKKQKWRESKGWRDVESSCLKLAGDHLKGCKVTLDSVHHPPILLQTPLSSLPRHLPRLLITQLLTKLTLAEFMSLFELF